MLLQTLELFKGKGITFGISRAHKPLPELLERYELTDKIGKDHFYITNRDAVDAYLEKTGQAESRDGDGKAGLDG